MVSEGEIVDLIAFTSILVAFISTDGVMDPFKIDKIEAVARFAKVLLETCGDPLFLRSMMFMWKAATAALTDCEHRFFPNLPIETPQHLALPPRWGSLTLTSTPSFQRFHHWIHPAHAALEMIFFWVPDHYDTDIHEDTMTKISDSLLLLESISALNGIDHRVPMVQPDDEADPAGGSD